MVTSSAVVGSSAISSLGSQIIAMAIIVVANSWRILTGRAQEDELVQTRESEEVDQHGAPSGER